MMTDLGLLALRLGVAGMLFFGHGWSKLLNFSHLRATFPDPLHVGSTLSLSLAIFAEVFCALGVMLGIATRWLAVPPLLMLLVATVLVHGADPWAKKEFALLYAIPFLTLFLAGPGSLSLDWMVRKKK